MPNQTVANAGGRPVVAFVCTHNSFRSQVAEALSHEIASGVFQAHSAGTELAPAVNPDAVKLAAELFDVNLSNPRYKPKTVFELPAVDIVVTMGCGVACPSVPSSHREDWGLDDPSTATPEDQVRILHDIEQRVHNLAERIRNGDL